MSPPKSFNVIKFARHIKVREVVSASPGGNYTILLFIDAGYLAVHLSGFFEFFTFGSS